MILNVLPLALGVYPGLASAATLFIDPCAQTDTSAPFISQSGLYYASDVEIKIADTTAVVKIAGPPRKFIRETRRGHLLAYRSPSSSSSSLSSSPSIYRPAIFLFFLGGRGEEKRKKGKYVPVIDHETWHVSLVIVLWFPCETCFASSKP